MKEIFEVWNKLKRYIHNFKKRSFVREREIWFCQLGKNIGFEQDGVGDSFRRPVLILKKCNNNMAIVLPLTKTIQNKPFAYVFTMNDEESCVLLSQIRTIDLKRMVNKIYILPKNTYKDIQKKIKQYLRL